MNIRRLLFFFLLITNLQTAFTQNEAVFASEQQRFDAQIEQNTIVLEQLLGDELVYIHSNTLLETKADFIQSVQSGKIVYQTMDIKNQQLRRYKKIAVITGLVQVTGLFKGNNFTVDLHYTSVYKKRKGKWLLINWQSTSEK